MYPLVALAAIAVPTASDVQAVEESRVLAPFVSYGRHGRAFAEFAPVVETRAVTCTSSAHEEADCSYEARARDFFASDFGPWATRREHLVRKKNCWVQLPSKR